MLYIFFFLLSFTLIYSHQCVHPFLLPFLLFSPFLSFPFLSSCRYVWATLLFACWPYRMWVESLTSRVTWDLRKIVSIRDLQAQLQPLLQRATTYVSAYSVGIPIAEPVPDKAEYREVQLPIAMVPVATPGMWVAPRSVEPSAPPLLANNV